MQPEGTTPALSGPAAAGTRGPLEPCSREAHPDSPGWGSCTLRWPRSVNKQPQQGLVLGHLALGTERTRQLKSLICATYILLKQQTSNYMSLFYFFKFYWHIVDLVLYQIHVYSKVIWLFTHIYFFFFRFFSHIGYPRIHSIPCILCCIQ